jgi:hypothetical protein
LPPQSAAKVKPARPQGPSAADRLFVASVQEIAGREINNRHDHPIPFARIML